MVQRYSILRFRALNNVYSVFLIMAYINKDYTIFEAPMIQKLLYHKAVALLWTVIIFIGCSLPGKELPKVGLFNNFDKLIHFSFFFVFVWLWYKSSNASLQKLLIISIIYGLALELYQLKFVSGRSFDIWDAVADTIGAIVAILFLYRAPTTHVK